MSLALEDLWPPFALTVTCGPLTMRAIRDEDLPALVEAAAEGIHHRDRRPFPRDWASLPAAEMGRDIARRYWKYRATIPGDEWALPLVVRSGGRVIGVQGAEAARFPILRTADTFSWLTMTAQGSGVGTLMRQMICTLFFDELDARAITSGAYADNPASAAVSMKVGFVPNGTNLELRDDTAAEHNKFILTRDRFVRPPETVTIDGAAELRVFAGVARAEDPKS